GNALLFGEAQSRVVVSCRAEDAGRLVEHFAARGVPAAAIGRVGPVDGRLVIRTPGAAIEVPAADLAAIYYRAIPRRMDNTPEEIHFELHSEVSLP
ncbi:MAG TPA: hypothetical protein VHG35_02375, partial [Gemmatimonadales bacterium]|nr:hypothetical protein [Gemmatimonadales bacterium]